MDFRHFLRTVSQERWCRIGSAVAIGHYLIGLALWSSLIFVTVRASVRNHPQDVAAIAIDEWTAVFADRIWKCLCPLFLALASFHQTHRRPQFSLVSILIVAAFSVGMAWCDISSRRWDFHTFDPETGLSCEHYMTWWWYHDCFGFSM